jgi:hypothetical protein
MTDYTKSTNFATKDALLSGNPLKIVKGTELDTEFNNIATAVATKADLASPTFTGTPAAPTAAAGTNTTQIATTAFVQSVLQALYPVGSIYINASDTTNPGTLLGFGTWTAFGAGKVLVGQDTGDTSFDTLEETGGSKDATLVSHTHTVTDPGHSHTIGYTGNLLYSGGGGNANTFWGSGTNQSTNSNTTGISLGSAGSSATNANLQPYVVVKMWKRTA